MSDLYKKYDIKAPRYTSYPAMPYWNQKMDGALWLESLRKGIEKDPRVDLYIHVPFCEKLCWYCGCNRVITKNKDQSVEYVDALLKEFELYTQALPQMKIRSMHFGGGTPNFMPAAELERLLRPMAPFFLKKPSGKGKKSDREEGFEGAVEVDPRTCSRDFLQVLADFGFRRISFGIQDFEEKVQQAINRVQPYRLVKGVVEAARELGFDHVNFDLIWGLPKQTVKTVESTIELVRSLAPEQIAYYSYAHLPERFKHQRLIRSEDILTGENKRELYERGKKMLETAGYVEIGMDHYALTGSLLARASDERRLKRNFMGYTDEKSPNLLGLGASSISSNPFGFAQNYKDIKAYSVNLERGDLPVTSGHLSGAEDEIRGGIVHDLMCNLVVKEVEVKKLENAAKIQEKLQELLEDGLLRALPGGWAVTQEGKKFIRSIAVIFDEYFLNAKEGGPSKRFSQSV